MKRLTISDIAKCAGVSKTTVSRFLNGKYEYMSEETKARIANIIKVSEYRPSNLARSLKSRKSRLIGLVVADIENPFSASIIKGATDTLHEAGYNIMIASSNNSFEKEKEYIRSFISQGVDGLIVNTASWENDFLISLANSGMPIVLADRAVRNYDFDIVFIESRRSMQSAVSHVFERGYQNPALFTWAYQDFAPRFQRKNAFVEACLALGVENPEARVYTVDHESAASVEASVRSLLNASPEAVPAIITANEVILLQVLNVTRKLGVSIPGQLGLCGYDDWGWVPAMIWPSIICPRITTLTAQSHNLGEMTSRLLLRRIAEPGAEKQHIAIETELVVRDSTDFQKKED